MSIDEWCQNGDCSENLVKDRGNLMPIPLPLPIGKGGKPSRWTLRRTGEGSHFRLGGRGPRRARQQSTDSAIARQPHFPPRPPLPLPDPLRRLRHRPHPVHQERRRASFRS